MRRPRSFKREIHDGRAVEAAIAALTVAEAVRLETAAESWIEVFALEGAGRDAADLLSEAVTRTLSGARGWRKGVPLVHHLYQTMRSIASSWRKSLARRAAAGTLEVTAADLPRRRSSSLGNAGEFSDTLEEVPSGEPSFETRILAADRAERFVEHFAGDRPASAVLAGWLEDLDGPESQARAGITRKQFVAAVLRIRRFAKRQKTDPVR